MKEKETSPNLKGWYNSVLGKRVVQPPSLSEARQDMLQASWYCDRLIAGSLSSGRRSWTPTGIRG